MMNTLSIGDEPTLEQVLASRERRVKFQETLAEKFSGKILTAFKLNIPGPVKNNPLILNVFKQGVQKIKDELLKKKIELIYVREVDVLTGPEAFFITEGDLTLIKNIMISLEENSSLGRLYDLDVMKASGGEMESISREDLHLPERRCLICGNSAKACGRSRNHTVETMLEKILTIITNE